jgi:Hint domain
MASTNINGTYDNMYLVTTDEKLHGKPFKWDLVNDGSGAAQVNPVASNVTISGAPDETGKANSSPFNISVAGSDKFVFVTTAETTTFGEGFIVKDTASGQYYFVTNSTFNGASNPAAADLSPQHAPPPPPAQAACFMAGTHIATPFGETVVESLQPGDFVLTSDGRSARISWIGRRMMSRLFADPLRVLPVRIRAGALTDQSPSRDLLLSPDHAIFFDGGLFQAGALVNGSSIVRESNVSTTFTYYHVELDDHSLILAENVPAETFIDYIDRMAFDNWEEHQTAYPQGKPIVEMPYPRAKAHRQVPPQVRDTLAQRARVLYKLANSSAA